MSFWSRLTGPRPNFEGETANSTAAGDVGPAAASGDDMGVEIVGDDRAFGGILPIVSPSPWGGYPSNWSTPGWQTQNATLGLSKLIDVAWGCIDLNASVLASFPPYLLKNGQILPPASYLTNPDPSIYNSWQEFAKQVFWDYQLGEAFILPMAHSGDYPLRFRVVPPWLMNIELRGGRRHYNLGSLDVTDEILHLRYISNTADAHGHGPLEAAGARMTTAGLLQRYAEKIAETGGTPLYWLEVARALTQNQADDMLDVWVKSRQRHAGEPAVATGGAALKQAQSMSARDMTLLELSQFTEARIAILLGVPPFLVGLPSAQGESMTYSNVSNLFDFHERASLGPKSSAVFAALSNWLLPRGTSIEQNRADYSRPGMFERAQAYKIFYEMGVLTGPEIRAMERFNGEYGVEQLTGAEVSGTVPPENPAQPVAAPAPPTPAPAITGEGN